MSTNEKRLDHIKKILLSVNEPQLLNLTRFLFKRTLIHEINDIITNNIFTIESQEEVNYTGAKPNYRIVLDVYKTCKVNFSVRHFDYKTGPVIFGYEIQAPIASSTDGRLISIEQKKMRSKVLNLADRLDALLDDYHISKTGYRVTDSEVYYHALYSKPPKEIDYTWTPSTKAS